METRGSRGEKEQRETENQRKIQRKREVSRQLVEPKNGLVRAWFASVAFVSLGDCGGSFYERSRRRWTRPEALNLRIFRKMSRYATTMWVSAQVHCIRLLVLYRQLPARLEISAPRKIKCCTPLSSTIYCVGTIDLGTIPRRSEISIRTRQKFTTAVQRCDDERR